jgi:FkbM family methyltransferase
MNAIEVLAGILREADYRLRFTICEVGALPIGEEPFYRLLASFPGSRIIAFEPDEALCEAQNKISRTGVTFYPIALGRTEEQRDFYVTEHPMCSSLYPPNEALLLRYNNMEVARLKEVTSVSTVSLDGFVSSQAIGAVDFIKIDIQGAELEVFQGGVSTLAHVLAIVSEAELIEHYVGQPLFGDVCAFLSSQGLQFQKFLGFGGRTLKPIVVDENPHAVSQQMWSDVLFIRNLFANKDLTDEEYLKTAVLAVLYGCVDVALFCCREVDIARGSTIGQDFLRRLKMRER